MRDVILPGFKLLLRNPAIAGFVFTCIVVLYLFFVAAVLSIIPPEQIISIAQNSTQPEEMVEEFVNLLTKDVERTILVFVLFGSVMFVTVEFVTAGVIGASMEINLRETFNLSTFVDYGFLYTLRMIALEVLILMVLISIIMPFSAIQFVTGVNVEIFSGMATLAVIVLTTPSRFVLVAEDCGVFDALIAGMRFAVRNLLDVLAIHVIVTSLMLPAVVLPGGVIVASIALSLSAIWYMRLYLNRRFSLWPANRSSIEV